MAQQNAVAQKGEGIIQFIKFGIVGVSNTAVDWVVFYVLVNAILDINHSLAKAVSFIIAVLNSYLWNTIWTFRKEYQKVGGDTGAKSTIFFRFVIVSLIGWGVNVLVYSWAERSVSYEIFNKDLIPLVLASGAAVIWNFFANKLWTYKK